MAAEKAIEQRHGAAALHHLTGPSRGRTAWLNGGTFDVRLSPDGYLRVGEAQPGEASQDLVARLHRAGDSYEIEAAAERPLRINGIRSESALLHDRDMIEFDERELLSRFRLYNQDESGRSTVADILGDGLSYLRVSRQPPTRRCWRCACQLSRRLVRQTTIPFRIGVVIALAVLAALAWQQVRLNALLQERLETSASRMDSFAGALARAKREALTPGDLQAMREEIGGRVTSNAERLASLERRSTATARVLAQSKGSVVFIQGAYGFRSRSDGRMLRHAVDEQGNPVVTPFGQPLLTLEGDGPVAERQFTGTGFAVVDEVGEGAGGLLATNRHVALPWESDTANAAALGAEELEPVMIRYLAWAPGSAEPMQLERVRVSVEADLALLRPAGAAPQLQPLALADRPPEPGDEIIVMGYPTGLKSMLAQAGAAFLEKLQESEDIGFWTVAARLARENLIAPLASRGIVGQTSAATIVYDAETTHGGSGGPVLDMNGRVVAVNAAILPEFGGSNLGLPAAKLRALMAAGPSPAL